MGYTNYLKITNNKRGAYAAFLSDAINLLSELGVKPYSSIDTADEAMQQEGSFRETCGYVIYDGELILHGPHESCAIPKTNSSEFCKTNNKPYDPLVKLLMCLAAKHLGGEVSADEAKPHRENFMKEFWAQGCDNPVLVRWAERIDMEQYVRE